MISDPRARALSEHNPPALVWIDDDGTLHRRCLTATPNPDCRGCADPVTPPADRPVYRFTPPEDRPGDDEDDDW